MERLVESIPNFSEGASDSTLEALEEAIRSSPGAWLLDRTADADHNRSVYTLAGDRDAAMRALHQAIGVAIERIDMRSQRGQHPRIGAVDVVPFVPLGSTSMGDCVEAARRFGADVAEQFALPVFLYGEAAQRPDRHGLAILRRAGFEGLAEAMAESRWAAGHRTVTATSHGGRCRHRRPAPADRLQHPARDP